jgi:hypothetical protein
MRACGASNCPRGSCPIGPRLHAIYDICSDTGLVILGTVPAIVARIGATQRVRPGSATVAEPAPRPRPHGQSELAGNRRVVRHLPTGHLRPVRDHRMDRRPHAPSTELTERIRHIGANRVMLGSDFPRYARAGRRTWWTDCPSSCGGHRASTILEPEEEDPDAADGGWACGSPRSGCSRVPTAQEIVMPAEVPPGNLTRRMVPEEMTKGSGFTQCEPGDAMERSGEECTVRRVRRGVPA